MNSKTRFLHFLIFNIILHYVTGLNAQTQIDGRDSATGNSLIVNGFVVGVEVTDGGFGYLRPPDVVLTGGGGSGAVAEAIVNNGIVTEIRIINPGRGYTSAPAVEIDAPPRPPSIAFAEAIVVNGFLVGANIVDSGNGYDTPPAVNIIGGGGTGAEIQAIVENGQVVDLIIANTGSGYSSTPTLLISQPPQYPELFVRVKTVELNLRLVTGRVYEVFHSLNLLDWVSATKFTAEAEFTSLKLDVDESGNFFKVVEVVDVAE